MADERAAGPTPARTSDDIADLVTSLYVNLLGREPDPAGLAFWVDKLSEGYGYGDMIREFIASDEYRPKIANKLFAPPGHFYSPIVDVTEAVRHLDRLAGAAASPAAPAGVVLDRDAMVQTWNDLLPFLTALPFPAERSPGFRYAFDNPAYSWGDGSILSAMLQRLQPKRLIEVGSGYSSACTLDTIDRFFARPCEITFIGTRDGVTILDRPVQEVPLALFDELEAGDVLFIDSTHVVRTGSDVCFELFDILPRLARGVVVHFHDMFWPFEYPREWIVDENRSWNELYTVRAFLTNQSDWRIVFFNDYFRRFEADLIASTYPQFMRNSGGALWLQKC